MTTRSLADIMEATRLTRLGRLDEATALLLGIRGHSEGSMIVQAQDHDLSLIHI